LLDLDEFSLATIPTDKIPTVMDDDRADHLEDGFQDLAIGSERGTIGQDISSAPSALDRLVEFDDRETSLTKFVMLSNGGDHLPVQSTA